MSLLRRRSMMVGKVPEKQISFVPGTYVSSVTGKTVVADDGTFTSSTRVCYFITVPLTDVVYYKSGDIIEFRQSGYYTSLIGFHTIYFYGSSVIKIVNNMSMNNYRRVSYTATEDGYIASVYFENASHNQAATVKPQIAINGEIVVGADV